MKLIIFSLLLLGCFMLFGESRLQQLAGIFLEKTKWGIDVASRQRALERRGHSLRQEKSVWAYWERELFYSGLKLRFPKLTVEYWLTLNLAACAVLLTVGTVWGVGYGAGAVALLLALEMGVLSRLKQQNMRSVNEQLMKLLDFLGNYSITSGEVTGVLSQVSRYVEEPLKSVLEECCYEAQTTGDVGEAILNMGHKVEHPKFKELIGNMEVSIRYCADFGALVLGSKRSVREYLRSAGERKGMLREAVVSMLLLLGMSSFILLAVGNLVQAPVWELLLRMWPGRVSLGVMAGVGIMFWLQLKKIHY